MKKFGHYEVTAELGRGGMGVVYKGFEPSLNRQVAIKCLARHLLDDKDLVERFTREAKATAALNDPNVIQIYFIGEEEGQPFFAMEYIEGMSLDDVLKGGKTLSVKHAKNILKQACSGLAAAHKIGLVHRDIKPANMMITDEGILKIVDFGIARTREYGDKLTNTGEFVGTPGYLSPEVCIGKDVDARSDIFSLGIVFYEMLAGKVPFENDSPLGLMLEVVQSEIPDIRTLNNKVDKKTSYILNKMIAKSPDDRYQSCSDIIRDLGNTIENQNLSAIRKELGSVTYVASKKKISEQVTLPGVATVTSNHLVVTEGQPKSSRKWVLVATLLAVVGAAAVGYYGGYLPIPNKNVNQLSEESTMALADPNLVQAGLIPEEKDSVPSGRHALENENGEASNRNLFAENQAGENAQDLEDLQQLQSNAGVTGPSVGKMDSAEKSNSTDMPLDTGGDLELRNSELLASTGAYQPDTQKVAEVRMDSSNIGIGETSVSRSAVVEKDMQVVSVPKTVKLDKGVVVIAFGDPAVANPIEKIIESELKQKNIKVMNELFIPGMKRLLDEGVVDLAQLKSLIEKNGGQAMVIANVNYVGTQQLLYAGRSTDLINAQLDIDSYDIKTGDNIGNGFGSKLSYTSLNATDQASDAVMQYTGQLTDDLKGKI